MTRIYNETEKGHECECKAKVSYETNNTNILMLYQCNKNIR